MGTDFDNIKCVVDITSFQYMNNICHIYITSRHDVYLSIFIQISNKVIHIFRLKVQGNIETKYLPLAGTGLGLIR